MLNGTKGAFLFVSIVDTRVITHIFQAAPTLLFPLQFESG